LPSFDLIVRRCVLASEGVKPITVARTVAVAVTFVPAAMLGIGIVTIAPYTFYPRYMVNNTGDWGLRFLVITMCVTPVRRLTGWHDVIQLRRPLGLAAFFYSAAHLLFWASFEWSFRVGSMLERVVRDPFITTGTVAFVLLLPLAATSNRASMSWLGRRWRTLHVLTYVAAALALAHFWLKGQFAALSVRKWIAIVVVLLGFRLFWSRRRKHPGRG
jgi:sulfoxide reductase heme-binding subunit YedZ